MFIEEKKIAEYHRGEIEDLQRKVSELQGELKTELKKLRQDGQVSENMVKKLVKSQSKIPRKIW